MTLKELKDILSDIPEEYNDVEVHTTSPGGKLYKVAGVYDVMGNAQILLYDHTWEGIV